jgi:FG-GAP-like repeat
MHKLRLALGIVGAVVVMLTVAAFVAPARIGITDIVDSARIAAVAHQHPNFTVEQRLAIQAEIKSQLHPLWKNLSWSGRLAWAAMKTKQLLQSQNSIPPVTAGFVGNQTAITNSSGGFIALQRQSNCSLLLYNGSYTISGTPTFQISNTTPNYERVLHNEVGLPTRADVFAKGCVEATLGIGGRRAAYLGNTAQNLYVGVGSGFDISEGNTELYSSVVSAGTMAVQSAGPNLSVPGVTQVAAGDLNGDGLADIVGFNPTSGSVDVWLVSVNGTIGAPTSYALPGNATEAIVLADVTGDGKVDVVAATRSSAGQEMISVLTGNGNGTFNPAHSFAVATPTAPAGGAPIPITNMIAADLRRSGHLDIVGSNGLVVLNNGNGTVTVGSPAFPPELATSAYGPNLAAADFNNDGKLDLAVDNGAQINIYLGAGNGTFAAGRSYASTGNVGYLTATDLDGDGNVDLYTGLANGGVFGGDQFGLGTAYALMGNGDGSFRGAPLLPFVYNGNNLVDLTGHGVLDGVGVNSNASFTSYLGDGIGGFSAISTLSVSPITIGGQQFTISGIESYAFGDINGDGKPDLAYIAASFTGPAGTPGVFVALGNGQGGFATPTFYAVPSILASGDIDINWSIYNLHLADVNHDNKADLIYNYADTSSKNNTVNFGTVVQLSNGNGTYQAPYVIPYRSAAYSSGFNPTETSYVQLITDLNHDGFPDLIFIAQSSTIDFTLSTYVSTIQVALGKGDGTFSTPTNVAGPDIMIQSFTDVVPASIAVADMNGDGIPDIVALGSSSSYRAQVAIALGNGDGTFRAPVLTTYTMQYLNNEQGIAVADFNGDGNLDVAMTDPYDPTGSGISLGNGDGTLQTSNANGTTLPNLAINVDVSGAAFAGDLNGDGWSDLLAGNVLLLSQAGGVIGPALPTYSAGELTVPALAIGAVSYSDVVVTVSKLVSGPIGTSPNGTTASYNPANRLMTIPDGFDGSAQYYNVVVKVGNLVSIGGVAGADTYDGVHLTIPAVQVVGGSVYTNVVVTLTRIVSVVGGMPAAAEDQYTGASKELFIPAVTYRGHVYTNVTVAVGAIVSVNSS